MVGVGVRVAVCFLIEATLNVLLILLENLKLVADILDISILSFAAILESKVIF